MWVGTHNQDTLWLSTRFPHRPTHLVSLSPDVVIEDKAETGGKARKTKRSKEKKSREIKDIEVWVDDYDLERFKRMRDIDKVFARPEQSIILSRYDGSTVKVTVKDGIADIWDSRKPGQYRRMEEEWLANIISGQ